MILLHFLLLFFSTFTFNPHEFELACPLDSCTVITQSFDKQHHALDFAASLNDSVYAAGSGIVYFAGESCHTHPCAHAVTILHGDGTLATNYWHLDKVLVKKGDIVEQGDTIGTVGLTGITSGPHLHFSVQVDRVHVNPNRWLLKS